MKNKNLRRSGFTVVELLVVIIIIGILSAITLVSYSGITSRAKSQKLQSDLVNAISLINKSKDSTGKYPADKASVDASIKPSFDSGVNYNYYYSSSASIFCVEATSGSVTYNAQSSNGSVAVGKCPALPKASFVSTWGSTGDDRGMTSTQTLDGGYIIAGDTNGFGTVGTDMFLAKYDAAGGLVWNKTWGGAGSDHVNRIIQTSDGGYALTGCTSSFGAGGDEAILVKFDSTGGLSWSKAWGKASNDWNYGNGLTQTSDGGYAVTGQTYSYGSGSSDMFIAKFDSTGNNTSNVVWGGAGLDYGNSIIQTSDGGYAVTGQTASYGVGGDMYLAKFTSSMVIAWSKTWGGASSDAGNTIVQAKDGGYVVAGETSSFGAGGIDTFVAKLDTSGAILWNKTWGGSSSDNNDNLIKANDGGYVLEGYTNGYGAGLEDLSLFKVMSDGTLAWSKTWGSTGTDKGRSLAQTSDGGYVVVGYTNSYGVGGNDVVLVKFSSSGSLDNCTTSMCTTPSIVLGSNLTASVSQTVTTSNPVALITSVPNASVAILNPTASKSTILPIASSDTIPQMTETLSGQELYVVYPGLNKNVCKQWVVPVGKTIKGFLLSHETESGYDYFYINLDGEEVYAGSGLVNDHYVDVSGTPGSILQACMYADGGLQVGFGGEVTGILYN